MFTPAVSILWLCHHFQAIQESKYASIPTYQMITRLKVLLMRTWAGFFYCFFAADATYCNYQPCLPSDSRRAIGRQDPMYGPQHAAFWIWIIIFESVFRSYFSNYCDPYPDPDHVSDPAWIFYNILNINFIFVFQSCKCVRFHIMTRYKLYKEIFFKRN